jgi:NAD(P)-dependent dehydrogenase (short-subunit alcohol dehydrogenase family)
MSTSVSARPVALATGASRGIGRGCAIALAASGFNILANDREDGSLLIGLGEELAARGADSLPFAADVADLDSHGAMLRTAVERWGRRKASALSSRNESRSIAIANRDSTCPPHDSQTPSTPRP